MRRHILIGSAGDAAAAFSDPGYDPVGAAVDAALESGLADVDVAGVVVADLAAADRLHGLTADG